MSQLQVINRVGKFDAVCRCSRCNAEYSCDYYSARKSRVGHLCDTCTNVVSNMITFTHAELSEVFHYDPTTGNITYKVDTMRKSIGDIATMRHNEGYLMMQIGGKQYLAHRIAWFLHHGDWPTGQIDHVDHVRTNNAISNLRDVVSRDNQLNTSKKKNNSSGHNGVRILPSGRYCAFIMVNRKQISLGTFDDIDDAVAARKAADVKYGFHGNHGG